MMKMMILAPRRAGLTHDEFRRYVTEVHGPLVRSVTEVAEEIRHYHYNFPTGARTDEAFGHPLAHHLDIITQGWFDSREAQLANMRHPRYMAVLRPDEGCFADGARALMHYTQEAEIFPGPATRRKVFYLRRRRAGLSREEFQAGWRRGMVDAVGASGPMFRRSVSRYAQNQTMAEGDHPDGYDAKFFDVIDEFALADGVPPAGIAGDRAFVDAVRELEASLTAPERTQAFVAETVVNIPAAESSICETYCLSGGQTN